MWLGPRHLQVLQAGPAAAAPISAAELVKVWMCLGWEWWAERCCHAPDVICIPCSAFASASGVGIGHLSRSRLALPLWDRCQAHAVSQICICRLRMWVHSGWALVIFRYSSLTTQLSSSLHVSGMMAPDERLSAPRQAFGCTTAVEPGGRAAASRLPELSQLDLRHARSWCCGLRSDQPKGQAHPDQATDGAHRTCSVSSRT